MTDPLRPPLPAIAGGASLEYEAVLGESLPVRGVEAVAGRYRDREPIGQIAAHTVASLPKITELTGVTIGPAIIIDTSTPPSSARNWFGELPRICRTASIVSPRPCM